MMTLVALIDAAKSHSLSYDIIAPVSSTIAIPPFNTGACIQNKLTDEIVAWLDQPGGQCGPIGGAAVLEESQLIASVR